MKERVNKRPLLFEQGNYNNNMIIIDTRLFSEQEIIGNEKSVLVCQEYERRRSYSETYR